MNNPPRCINCGKEFALELEGSLKLYCPRCHHYQVILASTAQIQTGGLTNQDQSANVSIRP